MSTCLVGELVDALEWDSAAFIEVLQKAEPAGDGWFKVPPGVLTTLGELEQAARTLIAKAKEHDCIPWDDAKEVAQQ